MQMSDPDTGQGLSNISRSSASMHTALMSDNRDPKDSVLKIGGPSELVLIIYEGPCTVSKRKMRWLGRKDEAHQAISLELVSAVYLKKTKRHCWPYRPVKLFYFKRL